VGVSRVCWLVEGGDTFGTARAVINLSSRLEEEGVAVRYLAVGPGPLVEELRRGGRPVEVVGPVVPLLRSGLGPRRTAGMLARWLATSLMIGLRLRSHPWVRQSDLVHLLRPNLLAAAGLAKRGAVVWEMANAVGGGPNAAAMYRLLVRRFGVRVLANSHWTGSTLDDGVEVMHLSADPLVFPATELRGRGRATFLMAARLHPEKMQLEVVRALAALSGHVEIRLIIAGLTDDDEYSRSVLAAAREAPAGLEIDLRAPTDRVAELMAEADVVVAVRRDPEPFGLTVVEAMMCGRPVVAGAVGGPAETVLDGRTGWLLHDLSATGLTVGLRRVLDDRAHWPEMGRAAADHARTRFTPPLQARRYRELVGGEV
jgi:glycosyltransferase involved in cell wall biosynthesis